MKIAHVSPFPPTRSGIADYAARIGAALGERHEVVAIGDPAGTAIPDDAELLIHLGNNQLHASAYDLALKGGATVVLHDATLHHMLLGKLDERSYVAQFESQYGAGEGDIAREMWDARGGMMHDERYFRYGLTGAVAAAAKVVIVHNPAAAERAQDAGARRVFEIPHFVDPAPVSVDGGERSEIRASLGFGADDVVFAVFGYLRPAKRLGSVVQALAGLDVSCKLLVCGESASPQSEALLSLPGDRLVRRPFLDEGAWWKVANAVDVCVNLRYPSAAETSGIALRMMSLGVPLIVTAGREWERFPEGALIETEAGEAEAPLLREFMALLANRPDMRRSIGAIGQEYVLREHAIDRVTAAYERALGAE